MIKNAGFIYLFIIYRGVLRCFAKCRWLGASVAGCRVVVPDMPMWQPSLSAGNVARLHPCILPGNILAIRIKASATLSSASAINTVP